ncbi:MAG: inner membrane CreD family protein [Candidatus Eremiobacteraeota bacterium]|nr:inner membrane CreD family protein [Candidatus Eremiobacteraeota bacterium]MBV8366286.1 inner membrane CreD family protein [Candidatus Eremiobacteraeota bacterium]
MTTRIIALILIWLAATAGWIVLGTTLLVRTEQSDSAQRTALGGLWGPTQTQVAPSFSYFTPASGGHKSFVTTVDAARSRIVVDLNLDPRRKGLLWYNTYGVAFAGMYRGGNPNNAASVIFRLPLCGDGATYDNVRVVVNGRPVSTTVRDGEVVASVPVRSGEPTNVAVSYNSRGVGTWSYSFGEGVNEAHDFDLAMTTNFGAIDFSGGTLSPTTERRSGDGWKLRWNYGDLIAARPISMVLPERLQPGPLAQRITFWAPLSLLFYFFVVFIIVTIRRIDLHPMNYFFLAASFFAFHLLFAYTVDRLAVGAAFALCSLVSMFLTISYLRIVAGWRFAAVEAGLAQVFYLILFSLALFNEGSSGLAITVGAILTLFVTMQVTARIKWGERFAPAASAGAAAH